MAFGVFTALFDVQGNAENQLRRIQTASELLGNSALNASLGLAGLGDSLRQAGTASLNAMTGMEDTAGAML